MPGSSKLWPGQWQWPLPAVLAMIPEKVVSSLPHYGDAPGGAPVPLTPGYDTREGWGMRPAISRFVEYVSHRYSSAGFMVRRALDLDMGACAELASDPMSAASRTPRTEGRRRRVLALALGDGEGDGEALVAINCLARRAARGARDAYSSAVRPCFSIALRLNPSYVRSPRIARSKLEARPAWGIGVGVHTHTHIWGGSPEERLPVLEAGADVGPGARALVRDLLGGLADAGHRRAPPRPQRLRGHAAAL